MENLKTLSKPPVPVFSKDEDGQEWIELPSGERWNLTLLRIDAEDPSCEGYYRAIEILGGLPNGGEPPTTPTVTYNLKGRSSSSWQ